VLSSMHAAAWVAVFMMRGAISRAELLGIWTHQLGAGPGPGAAIDADGRTAHVVAHFAEFPLHVLGMFFPGVLWLGYGLRRRWAAAHGVSEDLRRFLVCGVLGPCVAFYLYPESRPRHVMPAFFPAAVLGAAVVTGLSRASAGRASSRLATGIALAPLIASAAGVMIALAACPDAVPGAAGVFVVSAAWSWAAVRLTRRTEPTSALAANIAGAALAGWFVANAVVFPCRAPQAPTRVALRDVAGQLPSDEVVYTTRTFPVTGEGYYNLQFHLARHVRAADLPGLRCAAPCVGVVTPAERAELEAEGWVVEEVGRLVARGGPPEVHVIRLGRRPGG
jgi:4-amino-4-deoxy-L-arabinose transferase-like glycosyltransferase